MVSIRPDEISSILKQQITDYDQSVSVSNVGTVLQIGDGIARIYGLEKVMAGELLEFEDGTEGIALNLEAVSYTHLRAHETKANLVCRLLLEKNKNQ